MFLFWQLYRRPFSRCITWLPYVPVKLSNSSDIMVSFLSLFGKVALSLSIIYSMGLKDPGSYYVCEISFLDGTSLGGCVVEDLSGQLEC